MRPLTDHVPKPLIEVAGKALIDYPLDWLLASGVDEVVVNSFYKADLLEAHLAKRIHPAIHISREETLLETGGGLKKALPLLGEQPFFSLNSDTICMDGKTPALNHLRTAWDDASMDALLLLYPVKDAIGYAGQGDFFMADDGTLRRRQNEASAPLVFTGVQLIHPRLFANSPEGAFSLNVLYNRDLSRIRGLVHDGHWLHIGTPDERVKAERWFYRRH